MNMLGGLDGILCYLCILLQSLEDMDHEDGVMVFKDVVMVLKDAVNVLKDAVKVLKDVQGIVSVVNHTTVETCVNFIVGTLKILVKYSPRGTVHVCFKLCTAITSYVCDWILENHSKSHIWYVIPEIPISNIHATGSRLVYL